VLRRSCWFFFFFFKDRAFYSNKHKSTRNGRATDVDEDNNQLLTSRREKAKAEERGQGMGREHGIVGIAWA